MAQPHSVGSKRPLSVVSSVRIVSYEQVHGLLAPAAKVLILMVVEEDTIAFASDLSKKACRGAGDKFEAFLM
jgi:hypothetical protein